MKVIRYYSFGIMSWLLLGLVCIAADLHFLLLAWLCLLLQWVAIYEQYKRNQANGGQGPIGKALAIKTAQLLGRSDTFVLWLARRQTKAEIRTLNQALSTGTVREIQAAADAHIARLKWFDDVMTDEYREKYEELLAYYQSIKDNASQIITRRVFNR